MNSPATSVNSNSSPASPNVSVSDTRAALLAKLEEQQERNRRLRTKMELQEARRAELQMHVKETLVVAEQEEESITNNLLRRLDSLHRERNSLASQLSDEEHVKQDQEQKLSLLKKNRYALEGKLRAEETMIRERLERQLRALHTQKKFMVEKAAEEATTLKQLRDCVERLQKEACADVEPSSPIETDFLRVDNNAIVSDPSMMNCLESEIAVVEALRDEAATRASTYELRVAELEAQIEEAEKACDEQRSLLDAVRHELHHVTNATNELHANNEVIAEWMMDREMFAHTGHFRSSSVCSNASTRTVETSVSDWTDSTPHVLHRDNTKQ